MDMRLVLLGVVVVAILVLAAFLMMSGKQAVPSSSGVGTGNEQKETDVNSKCIDLCEQALLNMRQDELDKGPCLSNSVAPGWVCDIVHNPRQDVDNNASNQCSAFIEGKATHFVEVDTNCKVIKSV